MEKIKIAQIGTSAHSHGKFIFNSLKKQNDVFEIVGYCMPENEKEKFPMQFEMFNEYKELTIDEIINNKDITAVAIETEEIYLTKYAIMMAKAGKHIHMEKPGGKSLKEFKTLVNIVKENNLVFHLGYMYRFNPEISKLFKEVKDGDFGEIISIEAQMNCIHPKEMRDWLKVLPGGMMFFLGCHLVDLVYQIQGKPKRVIPLNKCSGIAGASGKDFTMAVLEYDRGYSFVKVSAIEMGGFDRRQFVVVGTKKTVEIRPLEMFVGDKLFTEKKEFLTTGWGDRGVFSKSIEFNRYDGMMLDFAKIVNGEKINEYDYDYELNLYKILLECCK